MRVTITVDWPSRLEIVINPVRKPQLRPRNSQTERNRPWKWERINDKRTATWNVRCTEQVKLCTNI